MSGRHRAPEPEREHVGTGEVIDLTELARVESVSTALTGEVRPEITLRLKRRRCGECYRLIATPGDHADGCSHIPGPVS